MLKPEEERFIEYWASNRLKRKKSIFQAAIGLPLAVLIVLAIFINLVLGWYKRADMEIRTDSSLIIVILIACAGIVAFITFFAARYNWEQNEQQFKELLAKKNNNATNENKQEKPVE